jgi:hypothetical protein
VPQSIDPFLYIYVIALIRRILTIAAHIASVDELADHVFYRYPLDPGRMCFLSWSWFLRCFLCDGPFHQPLVNDPLVVS